MGCKLLADTIPPCNRVERIPQDQTIKSTLSPKTELPSIVCQLRLGSQTIPLRSRFPNPRSSPLNISLS
ncbi:hypothetical protein ACHWQZ_G013542 [Mnemiopsis leidyi]